MATEKRLIDANALEAKMGGLCDEFGTDHLFIDAIVYEIGNAPTVDALEVVHGRWEPRMDAPGFVRCSVCRDCNIYDDWADDQKRNFCPNCGAKMDLEEQG